MTIRYKTGSWSYVKSHHAREWARRKEQERLGSVEKNEGKEGYVYIFDLGANGFYKIGRTKDILKRLKALQAGNPRIKCVWSAHVDDILLAEKKLHSMFKSKKIEREVFALEKGDTLMANHAMTQM